jgi:hypothetical protein
MKKILLFIFYFNLSFLFAQEISYVDSNMQELDSTTYKTKCKNEMMKCYQISRKDTIINILYNRFKFGKLSDYSYTRIKKEIYRGKVFEGMMLIHYSAYVRNNKEIKDYRIKKMKKFDSLKYSYKKYETDLDKIISQGKKKSKKVNKCINKYESKFNIDVLHYYLEGNPEYTAKIDWKKDKNKIIKNYFFKYFSNYQFVLIKPDGEYLLIGSVLSPKKLKKLLKHSDWSKYIEDLKKSEKARKGIGFFNMEHIHNCL